MEKDLQHEFILFENDEVISDEQDIAEKMNSLFVDVTENLRIEPFIEKNDRKLEEGSFSKKICSCSFNRFIKSI